MNHILNLIKLLRSHKTYVYYSFAYGISTLVLPLGVQFLVNNLALSGLWLNISAFIFFIILGLILSQIIKHSQLILIESLQREIFIVEISKWKKFNKQDYSYYYFEIMNLIKSFSKTYADIIELILVFAFGLLTIILFHPMFLPIAIIILISVYQIYKSSIPALKSSIKESDEKYRIFHLVKAGKEIEETHLRQFLEARDEHFNFVKRNSMKMSLLAIVVQAILLSVGCYLVKINQLSVGQLVSAEIIISGIFVALSKLPLTLDAINEFETSKYKIEKALGDYDA
jgi:putative ABC transport system ATP-binding protein